MRLGVVILPEHRWSIASSMWRRAEEMGFDHVWTYDHLAWSTLRDDPWFGAMPTLTAAALVTSTIRLGTLVASPNFRHPVALAREVTTLDDVSAGRFTLGFGAGGMGWDATILGNPPWSPPERADRFAEFVALLDTVLTQPVTSYVGRYYSADGARIAPGCVQNPRVPFAIAASGRKALLVAAQYGATWVTNGDRFRKGPPLEPHEGADIVRRQLERLEEACRVVGRDPATIDRLVLTGSRLSSALESKDAFDEAKEVYAAAGVTDLVVHWPRETEPYRGDPSILEQITG
jgi:alkanesulfonate monooxygenase SsuD/methylene tetrahydromethanopterin reductase-like flavin-dependent oxidoreductase (luciferase family)